MGSSCCPCLPNAGVAPLPLRTFRSLPRRVRFAKYPWASQEWRCEFCRAHWRAQYASWDQIAEDPVELEGTIQFALHPGMQREAWPHGDEGQCLECDVEWLEVHE